MLQFEIPRKSNLIVPGISYPGSVLSRYEAETAFIFGIDSAVSHRVNGIMTAEKHFPLIVSQSDPLTGYLISREKGRGRGERDVMLLTEREI